MDRHNKSFCTPGWHGMSFLSACFLPFSTRVLTEQLKFRTCLDVIFLKFPIYAAGCILNRSQAGSGTAVAVFGCRVCVAATPAAAAPWATTGSELCRDSRWVTACRVAVARWDTSRTSVFSPQRRGRRASANCSGSERAERGHSQELGRGPGLEWSAALSSAPWQLSTWNVTALEDCTSAILSSRNVLGRGQNPTDFGESWKSLISPGDRLRSLMALRQSCP